MARKVAITIAGAVSLGSYEAGVMYEVLDALAQHNTWADQTNRHDQRIQIDVLTGASAGGMTAAITAFSMLFSAGDLSQPYNNSLYNAWVKDIDILGLLARQPDENVTHSVLSSDCVTGISRRYLTPKPPPQTRAPHPALPQDGSLKLGMAMSNLNGVDYARPTMTGGTFTYTRHADQYLQSLVRDEGYLPATWEAIRAAAVSCGAFPIAFSVQDVVRNIADFLGSPYLVQSLWNGQPSIPFCYTDGGVFQNEPLGMAKNLVEKQVDGHLNASERGYLFIAPKPKTSDAQSGFHQANANYKATIMQLASAVIGQAEFQDWAMAESINDKISALNRLADQLQVLFANLTLQPGQTTPVTTVVLEALFAQYGPAKPSALSAARSQLQSQFSLEYASFANPVTASAWLDALLVLEVAAGLHEKEEMYIYDFVADPKLLAGGGLFAFTGFFDVAYRKHDYDYGGSVAQQRIRGYMGSGAGLFSGLQWTPKTIDPINPAYNNLPMASVDEGKRRQVYNQIMDAVDALLSELGANWVERKAAEAFLIKSHVKKMLAL